MFCRYLAIYIVRAKVRTYEKSFCTVVITHWYLDININSGDVCFSGRTRQPFTVQEESVDGALTRQKGRDERQRRSAQEESPPAADDRKGCIRRREPSFSVPVGRLSRVFPGA